jgi:hypothetical protein
MSGDIAKRNAKRYEHALTWEPHSHESNRTVLPNPLCRLMHDNEMDLLGGPTQVFNTTEPFVFV